MSQLQRDVIKVTYLENSVLELEPHPAMLPAATEEPPRHHQATKIQNTTSTQYLREIESFKHYSVHVYK